MNYKGCFISEPSHFKDYAPGGFEIKGISYDAFLFLKNGIVKRASFQSKKEIIDFQEENFNEAYSGEYKTEGKFIHIIFDKDKNWELREKYRLENDRLTCIDTNAVEGKGKVYQFKEW